MMPLVQHPSTWLRIPSLPPGWDGMHLWVVHCPLALFLTVPVFIFLAMILFNRGRWMSLTALILLGLGLFGASLAQSSGMAARDYLHESSQKVSDEATEVLQKHEQLGSTILPLYGILFVVYLVLFLLSLAVRPFDHPVWIFFMNLIFLILLLVAGLIVVNTGELGSRLVHEFGIHGRLCKAAAPENGAPPEEKATPPEEKVVPPEKKPTQPEKKPTPSKEEPLPAKEKTTSPEEKTTPAESPKKPEKPTSAEKPKEKPAEEKPARPAQEKPARPAEEKPARPAQEKPTPPAEEKSSEKAPAAPSEEKPSEEGEKLPAP